MAPCRLRGGCRRDPSARRRSPPSCSRGRLRLWLKDREDDTLGGELVADHRADRDAREAPSHLLERRFKSRGVARLDHTFEAHLLDAREEAEPLAVIGVS